MGLRPGLSHLGSARRRTPFLAASIQLASPARRDKIANADQPPQPVRGQPVEAPQLAVIARSGATTQSRSAKLAIPEPPASGVAGIAEIGFVHRDGATRLAHLYQRDPLRVLFPASEPGDIPLAVLLTTSGGLVAGDGLTITIQAEENPAAQVTAPAAEKIYRSTGATTEITQHLSVGEGAWLEYLPPETILFEGARLRRETIVELGPGGGFLGGGILVFGRRARGERLTHC